MINTKKQILYSAFIFVGAGLLIYDLISVSDIVYIKIAGLVILMIGLYNSTKQWAADNPKKKDEEKESENNTHLNDDYSVGDVSDDQSKLN